MKKAHQVSESIEVGILLALSGGLMDAYSYLLRGEVFANAQTGNIILLGIHLCQGNWTTSFRYLFPIVSFCVGIGCSKWIQSSHFQKIHWRQVTLCIEILILCMVSLLPLSQNMLANSLTSLACGIQVQAFRKIHGLGYATTMCIGNLRSGTDYLISFFQTKNKKHLEKSALYFMIIIAFVLGAVIGQQMILLFHIKAILSSCLLLGIACILMCIDREKKDFE